MSRRIFDGQHDFPPGREQLRPDLDGLSVGAYRRSRSPVPGRFAAPTAGQKRRRCRDVAIAAGSRAGLSRRELASIFGLPCPRIAAILAELPGKYLGASSGPGPGERE